MGLCICFAIALSSCTKSPEQKVKDLVEEEIKKNLYFPESYDLADAKIDSAFSPYDSYEFMEMTAKLVQLGNEVSDAREDIKEKNSDVSIWSTPYASAYASTQLNQAKSELAEAEAKESKAMEEAQTLANKMKTLMDKKPEFIGYKATISYRSKNNDGNVTMDKVFVLIDKNLEKVVHMCDNNDYELYNQAIKELKEMRESSN